MQTDNLKLLGEAIGSSCDIVRFGSEFCEWKIPSLSDLKKAYEITLDGGKVFIYVTPRVSNSSLKKIQEHLDFLNGKGKIDVVFNDLGVLNILGGYRELRPHLGRQLIYMPARCAWLKMSWVHFPFAALALKTWMRYMTDIYSQTSLNYAPTIQFYQTYGIQNVDIDWIPRCFPHFKFLVNKGLNLSVHLHLIPVTITRKCHTARFLSEKQPEDCSKPCDTRAFLLKKEEIGLKLFLHGNVVFRPIQPSERDMKKLPKSGFTDLVFSMNPVTKILSRQKIDELTFQINRWH